MSRKPIDAAINGLPSPRERIWAGAMTFPLGTPFTKADVQDCCAPMVAWHIFDDYFKALDRAGFLERVQDKAVKVGSPRYWIRLKGSVDAPRFEKSGHPVMQGTATLSLWRAMKVLKAFDYRDLARAASMPPLVVGASFAKEYVNALAGAGYLQQLAASKPGTPAEYRLVRNTGPQAPAITRQKRVFDRNTGEYKGE